jgi:hypothetical protein
MYFCTRKSAIRRYYCSINLKQTTMKQAMKKTTGHFRLFMVFAILLITFSACKLNRNVQTYPLSHNTPMLSQKGEIQIAGQIDHALNFDLQSAYAVSNNFGVMISGGFYNFFPYTSFMKENRTPGVTYQYPYSYFGEFGLGYNTNFAEQLKFEIFGGAGIGKVYDNVYYGLDLLSSEESQITKIFIQPALGSKQKVGAADFETSIVVRLSSLSLFDNTKYLVEPGFTIKVGGPVLKAKLSLGVPYLFNKEGYEKLPNTSLFYGLGIQYSIGGK